MLRSIAVWADGDWCDFGDVDFRMTAPFAKSDDFEILYFAEDDSDEVIEETVSERLSNLAKLFTHN